MRYDDELKRLQERLAGQAARTFDRKLLGACTYVVDVGDCESKTATAVLAQIESVQEQMRRYQAEDARRAVMAGSDGFYDRLLLKAVDTFVWAPVRPKKDPAPLTFTALQETVLPDLYGKKQHAQLLAAAKQREKDEAARLREETNNKIGGLLRGFLGARREEG